jgi:hypothetical protein
MIRNFQRDELENEGLHLRRLELRVNVEDREQQPFIEDEFQLLFTSSFFNRVELPTGFESAISS